MFETIHVWLGVNSLYNDENGHAASVSKIDVKCNEVAAELLGPAGKPGYWRTEGEDSSGMLTALLRWIPVFSGHFWRVWK